MQFNACKCLEKSQYPYSTNSIETFNESRIISIYVINSQCLQQNDILFNLNYLNMCADRGFCLFVPVALSNTMVSVIKVIFCEWNGIELWPKNKSNHKKQYFLSIYLFIDVVFNGIYWIGCYFFHILPIHWKWYEFIQFSFDQSVRMANEYGMQIEWIVSLLKLNLCCCTHTFSFALRTIHATWYDGSKICIRYSLTAIQAL